MIGFLLTVVLIAVVLYCSGGAIGIVAVAAQKRGTVAGVGCARLMLLIAVIFTILVAWLLS
jgi:hypothetical protein